ncbi:hypothetical protein LTR62_001656 [Meristemomyces frigidus]|uniref:Amino acid transporter n=1 Tax=Meristemomyces frigidus TaxID=1508187 RepID=A0AAN7T935_9PEZI|nr:hypothetical protein LTR62_001656 [Meristemomyces frigidus]
MAEQRNQVVKPLETASAEDMQLDDMEPPHVSGKLQGTSEDIMHMNTLGREQETIRMFTRKSMVGFGSSLIVTWETILTNSSAIITNGAELSSMAATSGGQYHWVSEIAPSRAQRYLSYLTGWLCIAGWQGGITGIGMLVATVIQGLITLSNPDYVAQGWHGTLITIGIVTLCALFNSYGARQLPLVESCLALLHFCGLFVIIIILWTLAPRNNAHDAFLQIHNGGGWNSAGLSFMVGLYPLTVSLNGFDSQVHMSEETQDAHRAMPQSIMWSTYVNGFLGLIMPDCQAVTLIFTMGDLDAILQTRTGYPFIQIFYNVTKSKVGTTLMTVIIILPLIGSVIACIATASRQIWSFARDEGIPGSRAIRYVPTRWSVPLNAILVSWTICVLLALINIGSATALNAILALGTGSILGSYIISISCVTLRRLNGETLPPHEWSLGRWGLPINLAALCWLLPIFIFIQFPGATPTTAANMNFSSLLIGAVVLFATCYYIVIGRKLYVSPKERVHRSDGLAEMRTPAVARSVNGRSMRST